MSNFPVDREQLLEARKNAMSKQMYGGAIKLFCIECMGKMPGPTNELCDDCLLRAVNAPEKRRKISKSNLRKLLREHCIDCVGFSLDICSSPNCFLYPMRMNEKMTKEDWKSHLLKVAAAKKSMEGL